MRALLAFLLACVLASCAAPVAAEPREVAAVLRITSGSWAALNDTNHRPLGVASVTHSSEGIYLHFSFTAARVRTFVVAVDETYAQQLGLVCGASVGLQYAFIQCSRRDQAGAVHPGTLEIPGSNLWVWGLFEDAL